MTTTRSKENSSAPFRSVTHMARENLCSDFLQTNVVARCWSLFQLIVERLATCSFDVTLIVSIDNTRHFLFVCACVRVLHKPRRTILFSSLFFSPWTFLFSLFFFFVFFCFFFLFSSFLLGTLIDSASDQTRQRILLESRRWNKKTRGIRSSTRSNLTKMTTPLLCKCSPAGVWNERRKSRTFLNNFLLLTRDRCLNPHQHTWRKTDWRITSEQQLVVSFSTKYRRTSNQLRCVSRSFMHRKCNRCRPQLTFVKRRPTRRLSIVGEKIFWIEDANAFNSHGSYALSMCIFVLFLFAKGSIEQVKEWMKVSADDSSSSPHSSLARRFALVAARQSISSQKTRDKIESGQDSSILIRLLRQSFDQI